MPDDPVEFETVIDRSAMFKTLKNTAYLAALFLASLAPAYGAGLDCTITDYRDPPYNQAMLQTAIPQHQHIEFKGETVTANGMQGVVTRNDATRLKWRFALSVTKNSGLHATVSYTLIRPGNLLIVRLWQGGTAPAGNRYATPDFEFLYRLDTKWSYDLIEVNDVRGTCIERN